MPSDIERLHEELFGTLPAKHGTAYERIAAVVMAVLGWTDVEYGRIERPDGLLAYHQLDVVCRHPDGRRDRLIIECKDLTASDVDQDVLLKLVAVQARLGAEHAAVVTTKGFTRGARQVATDHDIAMIRLRPYAPATDDGTWVRAVSIEFRLGFPIQKDIQLVTENGIVDANSVRAPMESWMEARSVDGDASWTVGELFGMGAVVDEQPPDLIRKKLSLDSPVQIETSSGWISISGMSWTEETVWATDHVETRATGVPRLVLQQIDQAGEVYSGRVIVTDKLETWEIDEATGKVQRRKLP